MSGEPDETWTYYCRTDDRRLYATPPEILAPEESAMTTATTPKRHHVFRWIFLAVQALFVAWIVVGASSAGSGSTACAKLTGEALKTCQDAGTAGTAIGVGLVIFLWAAVDVILGVTYLIFRRRG